MIPVSVVVPAYNAEKTLAETLASVQAQTVAPCEVIVADDGSTDATCAIASEFGAIVHRQENRGLPGAARNAGAARANGTWIAYIDSDDVWAPEKLALSWSAIEADPSLGVVFSDFWQFDERGLLNASVIAEVHRHFGGVRRERVTHDVWRCDRETLADALARQGVMQTSTILVRKDLLDAVGGFDETLSYSEDIDLALRLLAHCDALFVDVPLMGYRRHAGNMTTNRSRARAGDVAVAERVMRDPSRFLDSTVRWYRRERPAILFRAGRMYSGDGDQRTARRLLAQSVRERPSLPALTWLTVSYAAGNPLGRAAVTRATKAWFEFRAWRAGLRSAQR